MTIARDLGTGRASLGRVLDFAWGAGIFTASDAMPATSLTRSTAIEAIETLVEVGILRELPNARDAGEYRAGRPARRFELPADLAVVAGVDAGDTHLSLRIADLQGRTLFSDRTDLDPAHTVAERQEAVERHIDSVVAASGIGDRQILALCAGVAAPVGRDGASPPHPQGFWDRTNARFAESLADRALVVEIKNDAQLAATAEATHGGAIGCRDYIALLAGARLGAGVVVDGHLLHGAHGGVGEMFAFDYVRGVDSAFGLGRVIQERASALLSAGEIPADAAWGALRADTIDAEHVLALAASADPDALRIAGEVGGMLARIVGVLGNMFDPERIIVCGAIAEGLEPVLEAARAGLAPHLHLPAPKLVRSRLGADIVTQGAVSRALESARHSALPRLAEQRLRA